MGASADAILVFGVDLGEESEDLPWVTEEDDDFEEWYAALHGISHDALWEEYHAWERTQTNLVDPVRVFETEHPEWREALNAYYAAKREILKTVPIEPVFHCSGDYSMYIIAVPDTVTRAWQGSPQIIQALDQIDEDKIEAAATFCTQHDIPFDNPAWLLASYYSY